MFITDGNVPQMLLRTYYLFVNLILTLKKKTTQFEYIDITHKISNFSFKDTGWVKRFTISYQRNNTGTIFAAKCSQMNCTSISQIIKKKVLNLASYLKS